tara:strand:+ start:90 stop:302 length:213 start_codon:yes stop_codon:yes gene_type:complete
MTLLYYISLYLFIGACFQVMYDFIDRKFIVEKKHRLDDYDKIISILIWPIGFLIFLYSFIIAFINSEKDD